MQQFSDSMDPVLVPPNDATCNPHLCLSKRLQREVAELTKRYREVTVTVSSPPFSKWTVHVCEINETTKEKQTFDFQMTSTYPFSAPKIWYQSQPYLDYVRPNMARLAVEREWIKRFTGNECFCCHTYNCSDNWAPSVTLQKIIDEIHQIKEYKRILIYKLLADKIKDKYLIQDIPLDCWLF